MINEEAYKSTRKDNNQGILVRNIFAAPMKGILWPWNLQTLWKKEDDLLFCIAAFWLGVHPKPLLMDLLRPLNSGMVVEDHESTEGVILEFLETYTDGTTTILLGTLNKQYELSDKTHSVLHKSDQTDPQIQCIIPG